MSDNENAGTNEDYTEKAIKIAESGPFKALLNPAFEPLGSFFGEVATDWVDGWRAKRRERLRAHSARVQKIEPAAVAQPPTEKGAFLTIDWANYAQSIDPSDEPELSALWQSVLGRILNGESALQQMMDALKAMDTQTAKKLLGWVKDKRPTDSRESQLCMRMEALGLLSRRRLDFHEVAASAAPLFAFIVLAALSMTLRDVFDYILPATDAVNAERIYAITMTGMKFIIFCLALWVVVRAIRIIRDGSIFRITELGRSLRDSGLKYVS